MNLMSMSMSMYWIAVHKEYAEWADGRAGKNLPYISCKEYAHAQFLANNFVLSKDRLWTIKNYIAWAIQKVFL